MAQVTGYPGGGIRLTKSVLILAGVGNPNTSATIDVQAAGSGSLFLRQDGGTLWVCSTGAVRKAGTQPFVAAVWTQLT
jgi:hypothetical protein